MSNTATQNWERFKRFYTEFPTISLAVDLSRMDLPDDFYSKADIQMKKAFSDMDALESGAIANPDENRMVGHYWLRNPSLAPTNEIRAEIENAIGKVKSFASKIHSGEILGSGGKFKNYLLIGIGGSALGPQFVANALSHPASDKIKPHFFDNTDPDGMERTIAALGNELNKTLSIVISKSGGTKETRNGMLEAKTAYEKAGLDFGKHSVAITQKGSDLDKFAMQGGWLDTFPMWDWVGGRTSELSTVGLLPAALQGFDIQQILDGAKACDEVTRAKAAASNPAAQLAAAWYRAGNGMGEKNMVVIPYKDRLELFSKYLQQLVMESLGKEKDLDGKVVNQGIAVFGNKGSTDQHSYIQQLRDGVNNFFCVFIEVLVDQKTDSLRVDENTTSGDYLQGFLLGTRRALHESGRESITITVKEASPFTVGALIALFERAVGFYATLVNINAYHQPGVEAGKKAAAAVLDVQRRVITYLVTARDAVTAEEIAKATDSDAESVFKICEHLASNTGRGLSKIIGKTPFDSKYRAK